VDHPIVGLFAYQEALLIEAAFGLALLVMLWAGFRRWLRHKERLGHLIAEQAAQRASQHGAQMERVEARLTTIEQRMSDSGLGAAAQIETDGMGLPAEPVEGRDKA
jgi:hypothetical protein